MPVDKSLYEAPEGIAAMADPMEGLEIEVEMDTDEGTLEIDLDPKGEADEGINAFDANLAEYLPEDVLVRIATELDFQTDNDKRSRSDWETTYKEGLKLLGLKIEDRKEPWDGACGISHPVITEAVVKFQSECVTETFPAAGPVRTKIRGKETPDKKDAAKRVEADMNWELTENMPEFRKEHERLLWELPSVGCGFKKVYFDPSIGRQTSVFVPAEDVLLPYGTTDLSTCYRITHVMRKHETELIRLQEAKFYRDVMLGEAPRLQDDIKDAKDRETGVSDINDDRFILHECHVDLVIEGDPLRNKKSKIAYPYVVTYVKNGAGNGVLSIYRNWLEDDDLYKKRDHFVQYDYIPGFGAYGYGLFHLIGGYAKGATSMLRQLVDAGTLSNLPGGLKSRGLRIKGEDAPIRPGEFRDVDVVGGNIRDAILPLPYKEPSAVLAGLMEKVIEDARRFAATADLQISDMSAQAPVGTTLALIERQLKVLSAVQTRVHHSLGKELKLLKACIRDYGTDVYEYEPDEGEPHSKKADYDSVDVTPVSDPSAATMAQRVVQHQASIQMAQMAPEIYDLPFLHREMLETLGFKNAAKIIPLDEDLKPKDPVSENMAILRSEPIKAFLHQDHMAHIATHQAMMQDPMMMQLLGQNPKAQEMMGAMQSHIAEHAAYSYRQQIELQLGITLPPEGEELPPQIETTLSSLMAQAAQQVLQANQAQAAQQAAQAAAQDPMLQIEQQRLAIDKQKADQGDKKLELDALKVLGDIAHKTDQIDLQRDEMEGKYEAEGIRLGADVARNNTDTAMRQAESQLVDGRERDKMAQGERMAARSATESRIAEDKRAKDAQAAEERKSAEKPPAGDQ